MNNSPIISRNVGISKEEFGVGLLCFVAIFMGVFARFNELGAWCLAVDEFYIAKSVDLIQQRGIPLYPDGGMYWRGLFFQYIAAASAVLFGLNEFALRLPAVLFNLLSIPPLYWMGKKRIGNAGALFLIAFFCVSTWEVEFARFGRMYSMFQCTFLWFVYFFHEGFFLGRQRAILWSYAIAFLSIFVYEGAIFLACLLFLPLLFRGVSIPYQLRYGIWASVILLMNVVTPRVLGWFFPGDPGNDYPKGFVLQQEGGGVLLFPDFSLWEAVVLRGDLWGMGYVLLGLMGIVLAYMQMQSSLWDWRQKIIGLTLLVCALFQLFGLVLGLLVILYLTHNFEPKMVLRQTIERNMAIFLFVCLGFWLTFGVLAASGHILTPGAESLTLHQILAVLFHYPRVLEEFVFLWGDVMPYLMGVSCLFGVVVLWGSRNSKHFLKEHFLLLVLASCLLILGVINTLYNSTRYSFFLYPLVLLLWFEGSLTFKSWFASMSFEKGRTGKVTKVAAIFVPFGLLLLSEDFSFAHLINIGKAEVNFRMNISEKLAIHYYPRVDVRGPAEYINQAWKPGDLVINAVPSSSFYLTHPNYIFYDEQSSLFRENSKNEGRKDRWGNLIVYDKGTVQRAVQGSEGTVWILTKPRYQFLLIEWVTEAFGEKLLEIQSAVPGKDQRIQVIKVVQTQSLL